MFSSNFLSLKQREVQWLNVFVVRTYKTRKTNSGFYQFL